MSDLLDQYLSPRPASADPLDDAIDRDLSAKAFVGMRQPGNPDQAGRANILSREVGLPADTVERNLPAIEGEVQSRHARNLMDAHPSIAAWASDPRHAAVGRDDMPNLARNATYWANRLKGQGEIRAIAPPSTSVGSIARGLVGGFIDSFRGIGSAINEVASDLSRPTAANAYWRQQASRRSQNVTADILERNPAIKSPTGAAIYGGAQSLLNLAPALAASVTAANPAPVLLYASTLQAAPAYSKYRARGATVGQAALGASAEGAVEAGTELIPMGWLVNRFGKTGAKEFLGGLLLRELPSEQVATFAQDAIDTAIANPDKTWGDYWAERPDAMYQTAIATITQSLLLGGAAAGAHILNQRARVRQAETDGAFLADLAKGVTESKVRTRDPSAFARFMEMQAQGTSAENVYIEGDKVAQFFQSQGMDWHSDAWDFDSSIPTQIDEAIASGGDIVLKTSDFATHLAGTDAWEALKDHVRLSPDALSLAEARDLGNQQERQFEEFGERMSSELESIRAEIEPLQKLYQSIRDKLTNAGFTQDAADANAAILSQRYATRAQRLGKPLTGNEYDAIEVNRVLPERLGPMVVADQLDILIGTMKKDKAAKPSGPSLLEFIANNGGIEDTGGDLAAMGAATWHREKSFRKKLIRDGGQREALPGLGGGIGKSSGFGQDDIAQRAWEAGYFPEFQERPSITDLQTAIERELRGDPVHRPDTGTTQEMREAADELRALLANEGLDPDKASRKQIREAVDRFETAQREGRGYSQAAAVSQVNQVLRAASEPGNRQAVGVLGEVSDWLADVALDAGVDIRGFRHIVDSSAIRHIRKEHGDSTRETDRGQIAIADKDFRSIPAVLAAPDQVVLGLKARGGKDQIAYLKKLADGSTVVIEEVRTGRKQVAIQSMRKYPPAMNAASVLATLDPNAQSNREDGLNIVDVPEGVKAVSFDQEGEENPRGRVTFEEGRAIIDLFKSADMSTMIHESAHTWLEELRADATGSEATDQLKADWQAVQDWFAANGFTMEDGAIPVDAHELWARGVERYVMEGKAPSSALRRAFDAFRSWLVSIYHVVQNLRSPITPEIRDVMDRLVATDEEIAQASAQQNIHTLFDDAAQAGMTGAEFDAYKKLASEARDEAYDALLFRVMSSVRASRTAKWKEEAERLRTEVTDRYDNMPEFLALKALKGLKLDRAWLIDRFGEDALSQLPKRVPPIYADKNTASADLIAEMSGFQSGEAMVRALLGLEQHARERKDAGDKRSVRIGLIEDEVEAVMRERHGDPLSDGSIEQEALAIIRSERQGELIASELRQLGKRTGDAPTPYRIARQWAATKIAEGKVVDTLSGAAMLRYQRAASAAAKGAQEAMLKQDVDETYRHKMAEMLNNALIAEARKARENIDAAVSRLGKIAKRATMKSVDQDYLDQAHALLEQVDFRTVSQRQIERQLSFEEWARARQAEGYDVVQPPSFGERLGKRNWSRLSVEELLGLNDAVAQILHLGRLKKTLLDAKAERDYEEVVFEARDLIRQLPERPPSDMYDPSLSDRLKSRVAGFDAALLKMEAVFDWLDGGNSNGVFNRFVFRPIADAQARETVMLADYHGRVREALQRLDKEQLQRWQENFSDPALFNRETGNPFQFNRASLIAIALNTGNEGNMQRLVDGYGWNEGRVRDLLRRELSATDWKFVQEIWDIIETLWPEIAAMERRVNGVEPEKVEAIAIDTPHGVFRGGYYPAIYDSSRDYKAEHRAGEASDLLDTVYTKATTRASATKERSEMVKRPILLNLGVINRHLGEVIHDLTHREAVMQGDKLLSDPRIMKAVDDTLGPEIRKQFRPWLKYVANQWAMERAGNEGIGNFFRKLRTNTTIVGMGFRVSTMMTQVAGYSNSFEYVGARWMTEAIAKSAAHPLETGRFVLEKSDEVRNRIDTLDRDINQSINQLAGKRDLLSDAKRFAFHGIGYMDRTVSVPTWLGAYNKALASGMTDQEAIYAGDKAVRMAQGAGAAKDLAAIQRGTGTWGEALKLLTMFYSYVSAVYQRQRTLARDIRAARASDIPALAARAWWLMVVPPVLSAIITGDGPAEDEDWASWAFKNMTFQAFGAIPGVRDIVRPAWAKVTGGHSFGYQMSPIARAGETIVNTIGDAAKIVQGEETKRATRNALETVGYTTGLVPGQIAASVQFLVDVGYGEQDPENLREWWQGLSSGRIREE